MTVKPSPTMLAALDALMAIGSTSATMASTVAAATALTLVVRECPEASA